MTKNTCPYDSWFFGKLKITFPKIEIEFNNHKSLIINDVKNEIPFKI